MGSISSSSMSQTLTNYASGFAQDIKNALAEFFAPTVTVGSSIGKYKAFSDRNAFQVVDTNRAIGGAAKRIEFLASDADYNCQPQSLEIAIDDAEREAAGNSDPIDIEKAKVETLVSAAVASHEDRVFTKMATVSAVAGTGVWSDADIDPINEIDEQIKLITIETGMMPNRIGIGIGAWATLRNHPRVVARQPGAQQVGLSTAAFASMLLNPDIEVRVGIISKDLSKVGTTTKNIQNIVGSNVYVFIGSNHPTVYDPSFAKTFRTRSGGVDAVRKYRSENNRSDILALDWSEDIQVVSTSAVRRITVS